MKKPNLGILLKPVSHDCNMACDYCYYRPVAGLYPDAPRPRMSLDVVDAVCEQYLRLEPQEIKLGWQGGEPTLMGLDFYRRVVEVERRRARPGDCFGNSLQTNGVVLDEEWCSFLAANRFLVGLSLDGPAELNAVRRFPNGRPAFDAAERALSLLKAHRVEFNVLVVISRANVAHPDRIFRFLVENDLHYAQFIPCTEPAGAPRQVSDLSVSADAYAEFMIGLFDAWVEQDDPAYYVRRIDNYLHQFFGLPAECCEYRPECSNLLTVEWNGDVYPCDFFVEERYRLGNVGEQTLEQMLRGEVFRSFARQAEALPAVCDGCPWLSYCYGGCYRHRAKLGIGADEPPYLCEANKRIFAHVFERLRFLKDEAADRRLHAFLNRIGQDVAAGRVKGGPHTPGPARRGALSRGGPRSPQRNDLCPCGSGRKYKHCCGKAVGLSHRSP
jgi:uncharacterized protein